MCFFFLFWRFRRLLCFFLESTVSNKEQVTSEIQEDLYPSASASTSAFSDVTIPISHSSQSVSHQTDGSSLPRSIHTEANIESRSIAADEPKVEMDERGGEGEEERVVESSSMELQREAIAPKASELLPQPNSEATTHKPAENEADAPLVPDQDDSAQHTGLEAILPPPPPLPSALRPKLFPAPPTPGGSVVSSPMAGIKPLPPTAPPPASTRMVSRVLEESADIESVAGSPATHPLVLPPRSGATAGDEEYSKLFTTEPESEVVADTSNAEIAPMKSPLLSISGEEKRRRQQAEQQQKDGVLSRGLGRKAHGDGDESDGEGIPLPIPHRISLEATRKASLAEQIYDLRDEDDEGTSEVPLTRPSRGAPPPPEVDTDSNYDEGQDEDGKNAHQALHHTLPAPAISPPRRSLPPPPRARPPPPALFVPEAEAEAEAELEQAQPGNETRGQPSLSMLLPPLSVASVREVLDEEEGGK